MPATPASLSSTLIVSSWFSFPHFHSQFTTHPRTTTDSDDAESQHWYLNLKDSIFRQHQIRLHVDDKLGQLIFESTNTCGLPVFDKTVAK